MTRTKTGSIHLRDWCCTITASAGVTLVASFQGHAASGIAGASATVFEPVTISTVSVESTSMQNLMRIVVQNAPVSRGGGHTARPSAAPETVPVTSDAATTYAISLDTSESAGAGSAPATTATQTADAGGARGATSTSSEVVLIGGTVMANVSQVRKAEGGSVALLVEYN